ncbi:uncharacterized protein K441DRAFT_130406 [Cenococcum geophilum 1.58]|uniref:uncharacterized protein n=1 Tax=Cenococcum geophilum 1.58 TaxID=794803 RepID=UPI00358EF94E|nr:hypothetical protein K441DRAFT_130406 [Cenococcum geophilum 1.58]
MPQGSYTILAALCVWKIQTRCQELFQTVPNTVPKHEDGEPMAYVVALTNLNCFMHQEWPYLQRVGAPISASLSPSSNHASFASVREDLEKL